MPLYRCDAIEVKNVVCYVEAESIDEAKWKFDKGHYTDVDDHCGDHAIDCYTDTVRLDEACQDRGESAMTMKKFNPGGVRISMDELHKADSTVEHRKKKRAMLRTQFGLSREPEHRLACNWRSRATVLCGSARRRHQPRLGADAGDGE